MLSEDLLFSVKGVSHSVETICGGDIFSGKIASFWEPGGFVGKVSSSNRSTVFPTSLDLCWQSDLKFASLLKVINSVSYTQ